MQNMYVEKHNEIIAQKVVNNLQKRFFEAFYVKTKEDALQKAAELIPKTDIIAWGGSVSVEETGLLSYITTNNYKYIDRDSAKSQEQKVFLLKKSMLADTYIMGTNAISYEGELVNTDANGNRTAALMFGPRNVIVIAGVNKLVPTLEEAVQRVKNIAAPVNMQRISDKTGRQTPCLTTGKCQNCISEDSICAHTVITRLCIPKGRIKVILVGEPLGF